MVDCHESKKRYRHDQIVGRWAEAKGKRAFVTAQAGEEQDKNMTARAMKYFNLRAKNADELSWDGDTLCLTEMESFEEVVGPDAKSLGTLTEPREFNLMFKTFVGALSGDCLLYTSPSPRD